ncbi:MAG: hypothetical protein E4H36_15445 [Spirochaetales bacterium]|nr:MAG: hypothetical protein E4H36_15445 [Spirochaetales bacterium]
MTVNWKVIGIFGAAAFIISIFAGIIGGVSFGILLLRSVIAGVIFGGLGLGIATVVTRFLPELTENPEEDGFQPDGSGIDIVLESDGQVSEQGERRFSVTEQTADEEAESFIEEVEETRDGSAADPLARVGSLDDDVAELEDVTDGIDSLPDISELGDDFGGSVLPGQASAYAENGSFGAGSNAGSAFGYGGTGAGKTGNRKKGADLMDMDVDPQTFAKAVQTIMKKD